jgi:hypothetical protein
LASHYGDDGKEVDCCCFQLVTSCNNLCEWFYVLACHH